MTTSSFKTAVTKLLGDPQPYNSNNAWGFGGGAGLIWVRGDLQVKLITCSFRHTAPAKVVTVTVRRSRVIDLSQTAPNLAKAYDTAAAILTA